jgi:hydroxymethylbilane synthase
MANRPIRIGTRGSRLARVQVNLVVQALQEYVPDAARQIEIVCLESVGDQDRSHSLEQLGGRGVFTDDIDHALTAGVIDLAVHSVKDLPAAMGPGLTLVAMLPREDPREALVSPHFDSLEALPEHAAMGSASSRRMSFLRNLKPAVRFALLRGNVEERVAALSTGTMDGTILAVAGLKRLGLSHHIKQIFSADEFPPDPGQGAIGISCRADDFALRRVLAEINHKPTYAAVTAERSMLSYLGSECSIASGALAQQTRDGQLNLCGTLISEDGRTIVRASMSGGVETPDELGMSVANALLVKARRKIAA